MKRRLVLGMPAAGGESGVVWFGTYDGLPVVVKRGEAEARPRFEAVASLLDALRVRGVPTPSYTLRERSFGAAQLRATYSRRVAHGAFEVICEVEPATRPDLMQVRHQIGVMSRIASGFLIPDNHIGRATVSSIAVAHEVAAMGGRSIACLNARDRNVLGFRRDLLTAAAYGVDEFLFVYGDRPETGRRSDDLTVRTMLEEARWFAADSRLSKRPLRLGVTSRLQPLPRWKAEADFVFVQASFSTPDLLRWRDGVDFDGPLFAGVLAPPSASMARKLTSDVPQLAVPQGLIDALDTNADAGVDFACAMVDEVRESGAFDGVHLIPVSRYRDVAARLEHS